MNQLFFCLRSLLNLHCFILISIVVLVSSSVPCFDTISYFLSMSRSRIWRLEKRREDFSPEKYFIRSDGIIFIILLKLIPIDNFIPESNWATCLNFSLFFVDFQVHNDISKKLKSNFNFFVIFVLKYFLEDGDLKRFVHKKFGINFLFDDIGRR